MKKNISPFLLGVTILLPCITSGSVFAEQISQPIHQTLIEQHKQTNTESVSTPFEKQKKQAEIWGLTQNEWQKYEEIKNTERHFWSPNLDPLSTLGIEAKSDQERKKYAKMLAQKEFQRVEKELKFQIAYDNAFRELYPNVDPISNQVAFQHNTNPQDNRMVFFTRVDNCPYCDEKLKHVLKTGNPVDIYIVGTNHNDDLIRKWAIKHNINVELVKQRKITLNHDQGLWFNYAKGKIPIVFKGGTWEELLNF